MKDKVPTPFKRSTVHNQRNQLMKLMFRLIVESIHGQATDLLQDTKFLRGWMKQSSNNNKKFIIRWKDQPLMSSRFIGGGTVEELQNEVKLLQEDLERDLRQLHPHEFSSRLSQYMLHLNPLYLEEISFV